MAGASYAQTSFRGGEWSKGMQGRIERPDYRTAMNVCLNGLPIDQESWVRRSGTKLIYGGTTRSGLPGRVISYDFKRTAPYTLEFTDGHLRFLANGTDLVTTNDDQTIVSISTANPAVVTTGTHGWATNDQVFFKNLSTNNPLLHNRLFTITVTAGTTFTLADAISGATIDGSTLGTFVSGSVARVKDTAVPYVGGSWSSLRVVQTDLPNNSSAAKVGAVLLNGAYKPYLLTVDTEPTSSNFAVFGFNAVAFKDGPYFDPVQGGTQATPSALIGNVTLTLSFGAYDASRSYAIGDYVTSSSVNYKSLTDANLGNTPASSASNWVAVSAADAIGPNGFTGADVGRHVRLYSEPAIWASGTTYAKDAVVAYGGLGLRSEGAVYWISLVGSNTGNIPGADLTKWAIYANGARWTWGKITSLSNIIDRSLSGSASIGNLSSGGGLAAAFDGVLSQVATASAERAGSSVSALSGYVGKNYTAASDQTISQAVVYPSSDKGLVDVTGVGPPQGGGTPAGPTLTSLIVNLRGKASLPSSGSDGTLLGTSGSISNTTAPITLGSTDLTTAWKFVWVEILAVFSGVGNPTIAVSELSLFNAPGTGTSAGVTVQIRGDALLYTTAVRTWRLGLYSDTVGWPTCGTYHEGRLWLSGTIDNRIDGSVANDEFNFAPTEPNGQITARNAIAYSFNSKDLNPIYWMEPDELGIVCGTQASEWLVQATTLNQPLSPTNIQAHRITRNGCADIEPRRTDLTLAVVQRFKRKTLEYFADVYRGKFTAQNLSYFGKHLTRTGISELAWQQELAPVVWQRLANGGLVGTTYRRDTLVSSQPPELMGGHRHTLGHARTVESITVGGSLDGTLDALSMVTKDTNAFYWSEVLCTLFEEGDLLKNAWYLDGGIVPSATHADSTGLTLYGLWPHVGMTVTVFAGGLDCGDYAVTDGSILVPYGDGISAGTAGGLFTAAFVSTFGGNMPIVVGTCYTSQGQLVRPATPVESGARNGPAIGKKRRNHQFALLLANAITGAVQVGTDFAAARLAAITFKSPGGSAYSPLTLFSGVHWDSIKDEASYDGMIAWQITRPFPLQVAAVEGFIETVDK